MVVRTRVSHATVRNVLRASALGPAELWAFVLQYGQPMLANSAGPAHAAGRVGCRGRRCHPAVTSADLRSGIVRLRGAMHMKLHDGIWLEAGLGKTRNVKELSVFRACPW